MEPRYNVFKPGNYQTYSPTTGSLIGDLGLGAIGIIPLPQSGPLDSATSINLIGGALTDVGNYAGLSIALGGSLQNDLRIAQYARGAGAVTAAFGAAFVVSEFAVRSYYGDESGAAIALVSGGAGLTAAAYAGSGVIVPIIAAMTGSYAVGQTLSYGLPYVLPKRLEDDVNGVRAPIFTTISGSYNGNLDTIYPAMRPDSLANSGWTLMSCCAGSHTG